MEVINEGLMKGSGKDVKRHGFKVYALDGTDLVVERSEENKKLYPTRRNQHGALNHPELRATFATDIMTGVAMKPEFGATSIGEVALSARVIEKIETGALIIADRGFSIFSVASHATRHGK